MIHQGLGRRAAGVAFAAALGFVVLCSTAKPPVAGAADDRIQRHRYDRLTEAEKQELVESIEAAMESVHIALENAFDGIEIDVDLGDLDLHGLEDLHIDLDLDDLDFDFDHERFAQGMERFSERLSERMQAMAERLEEEGNWSWSSRRHLRDHGRSSAGIQEEIRELRDQIRALESELEESNAEGEI